MCHPLLADARLSTFLTAVDRDLAETTRQGGCVVCGAPVHSANYPRKPRGGDDLPDERDERIRAAGLPRDHPPDAEPARSISRS